MKIKNPEKRLNQFWGMVDNKHIELISKYLIGNRILDLGCGLGTTTNHVSKTGLDCIGIDYDLEAIEYCQKTYPKAKFQIANAEELPFGNESFDTIILRDSLHHFYCEADFTKVKNEILRVAKKNGRIIFFDPNVNFILRSMRIISFHKDQECSFEIAMQIMREMNCKIIHQSFNTVFSLPLSGGYVGANFVPNIKLLHRAILLAENYSERFVNTMRLGRSFCWRYLIIGEL